METQKGKDFVGVCWESISDDWRWVRAVEHCVWQLVYLSLPVTEHCTNGVCKLKLKRSKNLPIIYQENLVVVRHHKHSHGLSRLNSIHKCSNYSVSTNVGQHYHFPSRFRDYLVSHSHRACYSSGPWEPELLTTNSGRNANRIIQTNEHNHK